MIRSVSSGLAYIVQLNLESPLCCSNFREGQPELLLSAPPECSSRVLLQRARITESSEFLRVDGAVGRAEARMEVSRNNSTVATLQRTRLQVHCYFPILPTTPPVTEQVSKLTVYFKSSLLLSSLWKLWLSLDPPSLFLNLRYIMPNWLSRKRNRLKSIK